MDDLEKRIKALIVSNLDIKEEDVKPDSSFSEDMRADSLDIVELVMAFEEEFGIEIPDEQAQKMETYASVVEYLRSALANKEQSKDASDSK